MPWKEHTVVDQRREFIQAYHAGLGSLSALCREYGISRPAAYKWLERYAATGEAGLQDRSRARTSHPHAVSPAVAGLLCEIRKARPTFGPRTLVSFLHNEWPELPCPAASTVGDVLTAAGLTKQRRRVPRGQATPTPHLTAPEDARVVAIDVKGWFRTGDGHPCHPLTLLELTSRYLLRCQALARVTTAVVLPLLAAAFRETGLPEVVRSDNGPPFASTGLGGLSHLSVWLLKLGIRPERIRPGNPQENGRLERFHRTLNTELTKEPAATLRAQQCAFLAYQERYNCQRPHAMLAGRYPADVFTPSPRPMPARIPRGFTYDHGEIRRVLPNGYLKWRGHHLYASEALIGEDVALLPLTDRHVTLRVGPLAVAVVDLATLTWVPSAEAQTLWRLCGEETWCLG